MITALSFGNSLLKFNNYVLDPTGIPTPMFPSDMDFIYLANDFDGTKIANKVTDSDMSDYLQAGTITKNGSGANCYLSNDFNRYNYMYTDLTTTRLNAMKAVSSTYTYFVRAYSPNTPSNQIGGVFCFRTSAAAYQYMIRTADNKLQMHFASGVNTLTLDANKVFKIVINGATATVSDMEGASQTVTGSTSRNMGSRMISFKQETADLSVDDAYLERLYGIAGIARATTAEEDAQIRTLLLTQGVEPPLYPSVTIGTQTWTSKVIDTDDGGEGITTRNVTVNGVNLGDIKFYTWAAAVRIANSVNGWHLPSKSEVDTLVNYVGGGYNSNTATALKATNVWSTPGTDTYGFGALPYGIIQPSGYYLNGGVESTIWQSDDHYRMYILNNNTIVNGHESDDYRFTIRLIKD